MPTTGLPAALAGLQIDPREFAALVDADEDRASAWASGAEPAPCWLASVVEGWRDHPGLLAVARETAAARLDEFAAVEDDDVVFVPAESGVRRRSDVAPRPARRGSRGR